MNVALYEDGLTWMARPMKCYILAVVHLVFVHKMNHLWHCAQASLIRMFQSNKIH